MKQFFLAVLIILAFFLWGNHLSYPPKPYYDEIFFVPTAKEYLNWNIGAYDYHYRKNSNLDWIHPPLSRLISVVFFVIFDNNSFGWRISSLLLGVASLGIFYWTVDKLFGEILITLFSSLLFLFDLLPMIQSRIMMNEIDLIFFSLCALLTFLYYKQKPTLIRIFLVGLFCGGAIASRWNGLLLIILIFVLTGYIRTVRKEKFLWIIDAVILIFISFSIYLASYTQYFLLGGTLLSFWILQKDIVFFHLYHVAPNNYSASWWTWPLMLRTTLYFKEIASNESIRAIYAIGNPAIWWLGIGSLVYVFIRFIRNKTFSIALVLISFIWFWLPFSLSMRVTFLHYYLPSLPFLYISLGIFLRDILRKKFGFFVVLSYLAIVVLLFFYFYPIATGESLQLEEFNQRFLFESWK